MFYYVLKGISNNFNSVWVYGGRLYVVNSNYLTVLNLDSRTIHDWYSNIRGGRANETLSNNDIIDISIVG